MIKSDKNCKLWAILFIKTRSALLRRQSVVLFSQVGKWGTGNKGCEGSESEGNCGEGKYGSERSVG